MKQKKWLLTTASGMIAAVMLVFPAYAADTATDITVTDNSNAESSAIYQMTSGDQQNTLSNEKNTTPYPIDSQLSEQGGRGYLYKT